MVPKGLLTMLSSTVRELPSSPARWKATLHNHRHHEGPPEGEFEDRGAQHNSHVGFFLVFSAKNSDFFRSVFFVGTPRGDQPYLKMTGWKCWKEESFAAEIKVIPGFSRR
jgi:hypothetical protein